MDELTACIECGGSGNRTEHLTSGRIEVVCYPCGGRGYVRLSPPEVIEP